MNQTHFKVGVLDIAGTDTTFARWNSTFATYLTDTLHPQGWTFEMVALAHQRVFDSVESRSIDFLFVNPGVWACAAASYGTVSLATLKKSRLGIVLDRFGGTIIARSDRNDINTILDLEDKVVEAISLVGFGAAQMQFLEMIKAGLDPYMSPSQVRFAYSQKKIVQDVLAGDVDVGFVRTDMVPGLLSRGFIQNESDFKYINVYQDDEFPFVRSTPLYNEWPFGVLEHVAKDVQQEVVEALWVINHSSVQAQDGGYHSFQTSNSYHSEIRLQEDVGMLQRTSGVERCFVSSDFYASFTCSEGYVKLAREVVASQCSSCPIGYDCLCRPCRQALPEELFAATTLAAEPCKTMQQCGSWISSHPVELKFVDNILRQRAVSSYEVEWFLHQSAIVRSGSFRVNSTMTNSSVAVRLSFLPAGSYILQLVGPDGRDLAISPVVIAVNRPQDLGQLKLPEVVLAYGVASIALCLILSVVFVRCRRSSSVKSNRLSILLCNNLGAMFFACTLLGWSLASTGHGSAVLCNLTVAFTLVAFHLTYTMFFVKCFAILKLYVDPFKRQVLTDLRMLKTGLKLAAFDVLLVTGALAYAPLQPLSHSQAFCEPTNGHSLQVVALMILIAKVLVCLWGGSLAHRSTSLPSRFNNTLQMYILAVVGAVLLLTVFGVWYGLGDKISDSIKVTFAVCLVIIFQAVSLVTVSGRAILELYGHTLAAMAQRRIWSVSEQAQNSKDPYRRTLTSKETEYDTDEVVDRLNKKKAALQVLLGQVDRARKEVRDVQNFLFLYAQQNQN